MAIGTLYIRDATVYDVVPRITVPWTFRRGINTPTTISSSRLDSNNVNLVRMKLLVTWSHTGPGNRWTPTIDFTTMDAYMNAAPRRVRFILDLHTAPGFHLTTTTWADDVFWFDTDFGENVIHVWDLASQHYKTWDERIGGYGILNEPNCPCRKAKINPYPSPIESTADIPTVDWWNTIIAKWNTLGWSGISSPPVWHVGDRDPRSFNDLAQRVFASIRQNDTTHSICYMFPSYGGTQPAGTNINMGPFLRASQTPKYWSTITDINPVYEFHFYLPSAWQIRGVGAAPTKADFITYLQYIRQWSLTYPSNKIFIGEYGPYATASGADTAERSMLELWDEYQFSACRHTLQYNGGTFDASVNPALLAVLQEYWAKNSDAS